MDVFSHGIGTAGRLSKKGPTILEPAARDRVFSKIFNFRDWILEVLPREADRELFSYRITNWLSGIRRGIPKFPLHFPSRVHALSNMSKTQVRDSIYQVSNGNRIRYRLSESASNWTKSVLPVGFVRTRNMNYHVHDRQSAMVKHLQISDWPRLVTKPAWPSTPTVFELLEMSRRGISSSGLTTTSHVAKHHVTRCQFNHDIELASKIISRQIIGIRSDIRVPEIFSEHFRYRWNFLILTKSWKMPAGLVRFLASRWISDPCSLWLRDKCSFRTFLKKTPITVFHCKQQGPW